MTVRASSCRADRGRLMPRPLSKAYRPAASSTPSATPITEPKKPVKAASPRTDRVDLSPAGPDRPQQRQLTGPLAHQNAEGIEDQKGPDEKGDAGKDQQDGIELAQAGGHVVGLFGGRLGPCHHLEALRQPGTDGRQQLVLAGAGHRGHIDLVDVARFADQLLGGGQVEGEEGGAGQVVGRAELGDPDDRGIVAAPGCR